MSDENALRGFTSFAQRSRRNVTEIKTNTMRVRNIEEQRYNQRVRQAISDKYVEYSKRYADIHKEYIKNEIEYKSKSAKKTLSFEQFIDLEKYLNYLKEEMKILKIQIDIWDAAREICLDIADE